MSDLNRKWQGGPNFIEAQAKIDRENHIRAVKRIPSGFKVN